MKHFPCLVCNTPSRSHSFVWVSEIDTSDVSDICDIPQFAVSVSVCLCLSLRVCVQHFKQREHFPEYTISLNEYSIEIVCCLLCSTYDSSIFEVPANTVCPRLTITLSVSFFTILYSNHCNDFLSHHFFSPIYSWMWMKTLCRST